MKMSRTRFSFPIPPGPLVCFPFVFDTIRKSQINIHKVYYKIKDKYLNYLRFVKYTP